MSFENIDDIIKSKKKLSSKINFNFVVRDALIKYIDKKNIKRVKFLNFENDIIFLVVNSSTLSQKIFWKKQDIISFIGERIKKNVVDIRVVIK